MSLYVALKSLVDKVLFVPQGQKGLIQGPKVRKEVLLESPTPLILKKSKGGCGNLSKTWDRSLCLELKQKKIENNSLKSRNKTHLCVKHAQFCFFSEMILYIFDDYIIFVFSFKYFSSLLKEKENNLKSSKKNFQTTKKRV